MKVKRQVLFIAPILALMLALSGLLGSVRTAAAQGSANDATVQAFIDAYNSGSLAKAQAVADPNFHYVPDPRDPAPKPLSLIEFFTPPLVHVTPSNFRDVDANTVMVDINLVGGPIPPLPHPWLETDTVTFSNGRLLTISAVLSDQTFQDLVALGPPPGMPTTGNGNSDQTLLLSALMLGLLSLGIGVGLRRAKSNRA